MKNVIYTYLEQLTSWWEAGVQEEDVAPPPVADFYFEIEQSLLDLYNL